jgi:hypothetical protein
VGWNVFARRDHRCGYSILGTIPTVGGGPHDEDLAYGRDRPGGAGCGGRIDAGNSEGVTVSGMILTESEALRIADEHCAKYGKTARIQQSARPQSGRRVRNFVCVRPEAS